MPDAAREWKGDADMQPTNDAGAGRAIAEGKWQRETVQYFPRRLIVKLKTPTDGPEAVAMVGTAESVAADLGGSLVRPPSHTGRIVIELGEGEKSLDVAKKLTVRAHKFSGKAAEKIAAAGGATEVIA